MKAYHRRGWAPRGVAQPGSAPALGAGSRRFESSRPDNVGQLFCACSSAGQSIGLLSRGSQVRALPGVIGKPKRFGWACQSAGCPLSNSSQLGMGPTPRFIIPPQYFLRFSAYKKPLALCRVGWRQARPGVPPYVSSPHMSRLPGALLSNAKPFPRHRRQCCP